MILSISSKQELDRVFLGTFIILFVFQIFFWFSYRDIGPDFKIIENPPNKKFIKAIALGDEEFLFRSLALRLQNSGDIFAGFAPLKNYDYKNLYDWMILLDNINPNSNVVPHLATYYYSLTQNKKDLVHIIDYLDSHASRNLSQKWLWLTHAVLLANSKYDDQEKALALAKKLADNSNDDLPIWTKQLPAFIYARVGDSCMAFTIIKNLVDENESKKRLITEQEMEFMKHFIEYRLNKLKSEKFDPTKCPDYKKKS